MWQKPEDLELIAECESQPEAMLIKGLLTSAGIETLIMTGSESSINTLNFRIFGDAQRKPRRPYKVLVHPRHKAEAEALLESQAELSDTAGEGEDD